jgi:hypothetical protein
MIYVINFQYFQPLVAKDLTLDEVKSVMAAKANMSKDEYSGYSPHEQAKYKAIADLLQPKLLSEGTAIQFI